MSRASPNKNPAQWPPRSPYEALMSSPKGRERLRRLAEREGSPSPSPSKRPRARSNLQPAAKIDVEVGDDDDEETLQLKLQEIQARIKLKAAQRAKSAQGNYETEDNDKRATSRPSSVTGGRSVAEEIRERQRLKRAAETVEVPASPVRRAKPVVDPVSPKRVLLGIDKGLKASDVSLRRAPSLRKENVPFNEATSRATSFLQRATSRPSNHDQNGISRSGSAASNPRPSSFSERMAQARNEENDRREREARIKGLRSTGFGLDRKDVEGFKNAAKDVPDVAYDARPPEFSRDEIMNAYSQTNNLNGALARSNSTSVVNARSNRFAPTSAAESFPPPTNRGRKKRVAPSEVPESEASIFEPYSSIHLSKRIIPHNILTRELTSKKTFLIPDLLKTVKAPDFAAPDIESDYVVLGILAAKSEPLEHKTNTTDDKRGKFMILTICDLKWEIQLYLFNSAFDQFWKLTPGTVIAILNPGVMPPPQSRADTGKFNLKLTSDADTILEIGNARDLGFCKSVKKDGKLCNTWVDKRHTEFCDYHVNLTLSKTKAGRMEVNTMNGGKGWKDWKDPKHRDMTGILERKKSGLDNAGTTYDRESHSQLYISKGTGGAVASNSGYQGYNGMPRSRTTANMLDDPDYDPDAFHRGYSREERQRRHLAAKEKERGIREKLGTIGGGLGADYMRKTSSQLSSSLNTQNSSYCLSQPESELSGPPPPPDAASLGLLSTKGKAAALHLSPIKRKRKDNGSVSSAVDTGGGARGWGEGLSKDLAKMRDGKSLTEMQPPVKKKTRFVTAKGIREAGRESLGGADTNDADDDDDLDII